MRAHQFLDGVPLDDAWGGRTGESITTWAEIRNGQSSHEITDGRCFAGCWNNLTFCLWGRSVELLGAGKQAYQEAVQWIRHLTDASAARITSL